MFVNTVTKEPKPIGGSVRRGTSPYRIGVHYDELVEYYNPEFAKNIFNKNRQRGQLTVNETIMTIAAVAGFIVPQRSVYISKLSSAAQMPQIVTHNNITTPTDFLGGARDVFA